MHVLFYFSLIFDHPTRSPPKLSVVSQSFELMNLTPLLFSFVMSALLSSSSFELPTFPVCFVCFLAERTTTSTMSYQGTSIIDVDVTDEDSGFISSGNVFSPGQSSFASYVTTTSTRTQIKVEEMLSVWDFPLVEKLGSKGGLRTQI
jgi:hypothetical protein